MLRFTLTLALTACGASPSAGEPAEGAAAVASAGGENRAQAAVSNPGGAEAAGESAAAAVVPGPGAAGAGALLKAGRIDEKLVRSRWTTLPVAPGCSVEIADAPPAVGVPLEWVECADRTPGCEEAALQRRESDGSTMNLAVQALGHGDTATLAVFSFLPDLRARYVLAPLHGIPFFAVEGPRGEGCSLGQVGLSDTGAVVEVVFDHRNGYASRAYLGGPLREDPAWRRVRAVLPRREFPEFIGESVLYAGGRIVVEQNGGPLRWFDEGADKWVEIRGSRGGWACCADARGDVVTFLLASIPEQAMIARLGESAKTLHSRRVDGTSPVAIDGNQAVWVQGFGRDRNNHYRRVELWSAELTAELKLVNATKLVDLPRDTMAVPTLAGGVVAVPMAEPGAGLMVMHVDVPLVREASPPTGMVVERLLWVEKHEIGLQVGAGGRDASPSRVRRLRISSLPDAVREGVK